MKESREVTRVEKNVCQERRVCQVPVSKLSTGGTVKVRRCQEQTRSKESGSIRKRCREKEMSRAKSSKRSRSQRLWQPGGQASFLLALPFLYLISFPPFRNFRHPACPGSTGMYSLFQGLRNHQQTCNLSSLSPRNNVWECLNMFKRHRMPSRLLCWRRVWGSGERNPWGTEGGVA